MPDEIEHEGIGQPINDAGAGGLGLHLAQVTGATDPVCQAEVTAINKTLEDSQRGKVRKGKVKRKIGLFLST